MNSRLLLVTLLFLLTVAMATSSMAASLFQDCGDGTMADINKRLWTKDANPVTTEYGYWGSLTLNDAYTQIARLNTDKYKGYSDWDLPDIFKLASLVCGVVSPVWWFSYSDGISVDLCWGSTASNYGLRPSDWLSAQGFTNVQRTYWSSTTGWGGHHDEASYLDMVDGTTGYLFISSSSNVWPVRTGQCANFFVQLAGRAFPYRTIQDAYADAAANSLSNPLLEAQAVTFVGPFTFDSRIEMTLKGGLDPTFTSVTGFSSLQGVLTIVDGSLTTENVVVK